jgi:hypothetical protein
VTLAVIAGVILRLVSTVAVGVLLSAGAVLGLTAISKATREKARPETVATDDVRRDEGGPSPVPPAMWRRAGSWGGDQLSQRAKPPTAASTPSSGARSIGTAVANETGSSMQSLTPYGRLVWNLDGLTRSTFGRRTVCLLFATNELSSSACTQAAHRRVRYEVTFADAATSSFRLSGKGPTIRLFKDRVPLKIAGRFIACGDGRWLTAGANWTLSCVAGRLGRSQSGE